MVIEVTYCLIYRGELKVKCEITELIPQEM